MGDTASVDSGVSGGICDIPVKASLGAVQPTGSHTLGMRSRDQRSFEFPITVDSCPSPRESEKKSIVTLLGPQRELSKGALAGAAAGKCLF